MSRTTWHRSAALITPLVLVNSAAVYGQAGWAYDHLFHRWPLAVLFAAALESIGIYLAAEAHAALMAGDASARLRMSSYAVGMLVGTLNYAHFASPGYRPNPLAVTFGLLSSISPWLWSIRSRSLNRDRLRELGQIDPRAVRFSVLRWALFPLRTFRAFRWAVWAGIVQPAEAVAAADERRAARREVGSTAVITAVVDAPSTGPASLPLTAHVSPVALAEVARNLTPTAGVVDTVEPTTKRRTASRRKPAGGRRATGAQRRTAEQTRTEMAALRTERPDITQAELARLLGVSATRIRQLDKPANGIQVPTT